jgi:hypothetical protein
MGRDFFSFPADRCMFDDGPKKKKFELTREEEDMLARWRHSDAGPLLNIICRLLKELNK